MNWISEFYILPSGQLEDVGGEFQCEDCNGYDKDAKYSQSSQTLIWECSSCGHTNIVQEMVL